MRQQKFSDRGKVLGVSFDADNEVVFPCLDCLFSYVCLRMLGGVYHIVAFWLMMKSLMVEMHQCSVCEVLT